MKYIMISVKQGKLPERLVPIIFPSTLVHAQVFEAIEPLLKVSRLKTVVNIHSAGDIKLNAITVDGSSDSLGVASQDEDMRVINSIDYLHGVR